MKVLKSYCYGNVHPHQVRFKTLKNDILQELKARKFKQRTVLTKSSRNIKNLNHIVAF